MATIYIDFSAANDGDGVTAAQAGTPGGAGAFNTIVGHISDGDIVWIRRVGTYNLASQFVLPNGGEINGWPLSTDANYSSRPASGQASWDADPTGSTANDYATLTSTAYAKNILKDGAHDILTHMRRIHFLVSDSTDNNNSCPLYIQGNNLKVHNCYIERSGTNIGKGAVCFIKGASTSDWVSGTLLNNCILERSATGTTDYFSWWGVLLIENAHANIIQNCTLQAGNAYRGQNGGSILLTFYAYAENNSTAV
ncbi:MAG TPA: hypothetical protein EYQ84_08485, partial [Nitrospinaceae bacterium]|nr:hypothetical protein [Nitrospinaceae bacterium]